MSALRGLVQRFVIFADHLIGWILIGTVIVNAASVFMRYVMLDSISWSEEAMRYLAVWMTFLGAASASWFDEHMDMNMLADFGGARVQAWHKTLLHLLTAGFASVVLWQGTRYCMMNGMQTSPTLGLPMLYVYGAIALGGGLLLVVSLAKIYDAFVPPAVRTESGEKAVI